MFLMATQGERFSSCSTSNRNQSGRKLADKAAGNENEVDYDLSSSFLSNEVLFSEYFKLSFEKDDTVN